MQNLSFIKKFSINFVNILIQHECLISSSDFDSNLLKIKQSKLLVSIYLNTVGSKIT